MQALRVRKERAPAGSRRFAPARKHRPPRHPAGPWPPQDALRYQLLRQFAGREGHARVPYLHREGGFRLGLWVSRLRARHRMGFLTPEQERSVERMPGWTWSPFDYAFDAAFAALLRFAKREGHARVPFAHQEGRVRLGAWVVVQRQLRAKGRLPHARTRRLESVPGWVWNARTEFFAEGMRRLRVFRRREGHARVPNGWVEGGFRLGQWVGNRRADYRKRTLTNAETRALESVPGWTWNAREAGFREAYARLARFVEREGHARVPSGHLESGFALGHWVHKCRAKRDRLSPGRVRLLTRLPGWAWNRFDWQFEEGLRLLRSYVRRERHCQVPAKHVEGGVRLGAWVHHCRSRRRTLAANRRRALESVPGWTWKQAKRSA